MHIESTVCFEYCRNTGAVVGRTQSELTAFYAGLLGQGGNLPQGESYHSSWAAALTQFRLPPEAINYVNLTALSNQYQLRPEFIDSALFLWLLTGNEVYRQRGLDMWNRQKAHCKVPNGYTVVTNMTTTPTTKGDLTPGYWYAENMKYFYLMWSASPRFDYTNNYLTTEGNVLRGVKRIAAPSPTNTFRVVNRATGRVMDVNARSVSDNAPVILFTDNGGPNQRWITTTTGGFSRLTSLNSGKVLTVPGSSTANGTGLVQLAHTGGANQQWTAQPAAAGFVTLINRNSGKVADIAGTANGSAVVQQPPNGTTSQQWQLIPT